MSCENDKPGDKIRVKAVERKGERGIIEAVEYPNLKIRLASDEIVDYKRDEIVNFSRAARTAWKSMPKRAGRPVGNAPRKRGVTIRLEAAVWEGLGTAVEVGLIPSREEAVNRWLREHLDALNASRS